LYSKILFGGSRKGGELPNFELVLNNQRIDVSHLVEYNRVCGFNLRNTLPSTYLHILTTPLQMMIMTDPSFPFALLGLVHVRNRIEQIRPVLSTETLSFRTRATNLQPHNKGVTFDMVSEVFVGHEKVWVGVSTYLRRQKTDGASSKPESQTGSSNAKSNANSIWSVPSDIGRRYAAVSGDRNPIHLYAITARLLGFPRAIAHGMWSKASCLAALDGRLPDAYVVDVQFKLPILLPAKVSFCSQQTSDGFDFSVFDTRSGKPHLAGQITSGK
jgi:acyl dehydratase